MKINQATVETRLCLGLSFRGFVVSIRCTWIGLTVTASNPARGYAGSRTPAGSL